MWYSFITAGNYGCDFEDINIIQLVTFRVGLVERIQIWKVESYQSSLFLLSVNLLEALYFFLLSSSLSWVQYIYIYIGEGRRKKKRRALTSTKVSSNVHISLLVILFDRRRRIRKRRRRRRRIKNDEIS